MPFSHFVKKTGGQNVNNHFVENMFKYHFVENMFKNHYVESHKD
jgi:hypothetical protein